MKKKIKIFLDATDGSYRVETEGFSIGSYTDRQRTETFGNQLFNGPYEVVNHMGQVIQYDGLHLVKSENGVIRTMTKAEYEKYTGKPGSGNDA